MTTASRGASDGGKKRQGKARQRQSKGEGGLSSRVRFALLTNYYTSPIRFYSGQEGMPTR